jgi:hypothetical protein
MLAATKPGRANGRTMCQNARWRLAPSIQALSSSPAGGFLKNPHIRQTTNGSANAVSASATLNP